MEPYLLHSEQDDTYIKELPLISPKISRHEYAQTQEGFDPIPGHNLHQTIRNAFGRFRNRQWLGTFSEETKSYSFKTCEQIWEQMIQFGSGLCKHCPEGSLVGIFAENREEWVVADLACVFYNFISVPLANTLDDDQLSFIAGHAEITCIVCTKGNIHKALKILPNNPSIKLVVQCEPFIQTQHEILSVNFSDFPTISQIGKEQRRATRTPVGHSIMTILYTSGSTGSPKGAINSFDRWNAFVSVPYQMAHPLIRLCDQPLAHATERQLTWLTLCFGGMQCFSTGDMNKIFDEFQMVRPTQITASPRLYEFTHSQFQAALIHEMNNRPNEDHHMIREEVMCRFRKLFGDRIQFLIIGGAASGEQLKNFILECWRVPVYDGYGTTEAGSIASSQGSFPNVEIKLISMPELGYTTEDIPYPRGHIYVKTPQMISGYYKDEKSTKENFEDGWLKTGDIGELRNGLVHVIDRCNNIIKLSSGLFVEPSRIEGILNNSTFVEQIYVHGEIGKAYLVAVIFPNSTVSTKWAKDENISFQTLDELYESPQLKKMILSSFLQIGLSLKLKRYEFPASVHLTTQRFTSENGLLTISQKPIRRAIAKYFEKDIALLFETLDQKRLALSVEVSEAVKNAIGNNEISSTDDILGQVGTDSLSTVRLMNVFKNNFGKQIPMAVLEENGSLSVDDLATYLISAIEIGDNIQGANANLYLEAEKDFKSSIQTMYTVPQTKLDPETIKNPHNVLLTGASGFLGIFLLKQILEDISNATIYCIVRCKSAAEGMQRILTKFEEMKIDIKENWESRIKICRGDLSAPYFGLQEAEYNTLAATIDSIYHCGAIVNWLMRYKDLRGANVVGTTNLIKFAMTTKTKPFYHISTISTTYGEEGTLASPEDAFRMGPYALSKWVAEHSVMRASFSGLPVMIFKPATQRLAQLLVGMITGDEVNGAMHKEDFFPSLFAGILSMKSCFYSDYIMELNPVNFVASSIINISRHQKYFGDPTKSNSFVYHITNPHSLSFSNTFEMIRSISDTQIEFMEYSEWRKDLVEKHSSSPLGPFILFLGETFNFSMNTAKRPNLEKALADLGLADVTSPTRELIQKCVQFLKK